MTSNRKNKPKDKAIREFVLASAVEARKRGWDIEYFMATAEGAWLVSNKYKGDK